MPKQPDIDRDLTGGPNRPPSGEERLFADVVDDVFTRQEAVAVSRVKAAAAGDETLLATDKWDRELADLTEPVRWQPFKRGGDAGLRQISFELPEWIEAPQVVDAARRESYVFAHQVNTTTANQLRDAMVAGLEAGESIPMIEKRIVAIYDGWRDSKRSIMIARTETARAFTGGQIEAWKQTGIVTAKKWHANADACPFCLSMNGKVIDLDTSFLNQGDSQTVEFEGRDITLAHNYSDTDGPPLHPNCIAAETTVFAPHKIAGLVAAYTGPVVQLTLANGTELTVTPNHMLLTPYGFVQAQLLKDGDDVLYAPDFKRVVPGNPDDNGNPARIDNVIKTLAETRTVPTSSVPGTPEYLHGDGVGVNGYINIVLANGFLRDNSPALLLHEINQPGFDRSRYRETLNGEGMLADLLERAALASDRSMGSHREALAFLGRCARHPVEHSLTSIPLGDAILPEMAYDHITRTPKRISELLDGCSGMITPEKVVDVQFDSTSTHVYDLHSLSTLYIANGVVSSNCRCVIVAELVT